MKTLHIRQKADLTGRLCLDIPVGEPGIDCDIIVTVEPANAPSQWLPGFWSEMGKGWQGAPLVRPPQGEP